MTNNGMTLSGKAIIQHQPFFLHSIMKHRIIISSIFFLASTFVLLPGFIGCKQQGGLKTEYVEGIIRVNGTPVDKAVVAFTSKDKEAGGMTAMGYTDKSGTFKLTAAMGSAGRGTLVGEYIVTVAKTERITETQIIDGEPQKVVLKEINCVPLKYATEETSPLTATVGTGKSKFTFDLEGPL